MNYVITFMIYAILFTGCTIVPMNPRSYKVITYPDKTETCICSEIEDEPIEEDY